MSDRQHCRAQHAAWLSNALAQRWATCSPGRCKPLACGSRRAAPTTSLQWSTDRCSDTLGVVRAYTLGVRPQTPVDRRRSEETYNRANHDSESEARDWRDVTHVQAAIARIRQHDELDGCDERQQTDDAPGRDAR